MRLCKSTSQALLYNQRTAPRPTLRSIAFQSATDSRENVNEDDRIYVLVRFSEGPDYLLHESSLKSQELNSRIRSSDNLHVIVVTSKFLLLLSRQSHRPSCCKYPKVHQVVGFMPF